MRNGLKILSDGTVAEQVVRLDMVLGFVRPYDGHWVSIELGHALTYVKSAPYKCWPDKAAEDKE